MFGYFKKKDVSSRSHRGVEQLVARRAHNPKVIGSSPIPATTNPSPTIGIFNLE